jgi:hypothetical protein
MANKAKAVIWSLIVVILVLAIILIYAFAVQPAINTKQVTIYNAGYQTAQADFINTMWAQVNQQGYVQIPLSENQSLFLAPFDPQQSAAQ